jgi:hypothetical protein
VTGAVFTQYFAILSVAHSTETGSRCGIRTTQRARRVIERYHTRPLTSML